MWDVPIVLASMAAGAALMRWADMRVEKAKEDAKPRFASTRLVSSPAEDDFAPLPLQLNGADHRQLQSNGAVVKTRISRSARNAG